MGKTAVKGIGNDLLNGDWPALDELSRGKFRIEKKERVADLNGLGAALANAAESDDAIAASSEAKEEKEEIGIGQKKTAGGSGRRTRAVRVKKNVASPLKTANDAQRVAEKSETEKVRTSFAKPAQAENKPSETIDRKLESKTGETRSGKTANRLVSKKSGLALAKAATMGLAKIYVKKTNDAIEPFRFMAVNFKQSFAAVANLAIPILMTWLLMTSSQTISAETSGVGMGMKAAYSLTFYFACAFVWISAQSFALGLAHLLRGAALYAAEVHENGVSDDA